MMSYLSVWWLVAGLSFMDLVSSEPCICLKTFTTELYNPMHIEFRGDSYYIAEQRGIVRYFQTSGSTGDVLLNITDRVVISSHFGDERGLLGFSLHPRYNENGKLYVFYIGNSTGQEYSQVSEFTAVDNVAMPSTERFVIRIDNLTNYAIAGQLLFGHDGYLYVSIGDGTPDQILPVDGAQDPIKFLGKILRIDVDSRGPGLGYGIPPSNPFVGKPPWKEEVFAYGSRNMWRCSQDMLPDNQGERRIFCGDTGVSSYEEINIIRSGGNYGWNVKEGKTCYNSLKCNMPLENEQLPIYVYPHTNFAHSVVGGHVYRGSNIPDLAGRYLYGDAMSSNLSVLTETSAGWSSSLLPVCSPEKCACGSRAEMKEFLLSYGRDTKGELYVLTTGAFAAFHGHAVALKIVPSTSEEGLTCGSGRYFSSWVTISLLLIMFNS